MVRKDPKAGGYYFVVDVAPRGETRRQLKRRFPTYREARAELTKTLGELGTGTYVEPSRLTLAQWVEQWAPILRSRVRPSTAASYERNLRLHAVPSLGGRQLQSLKPADLTALYARLRTDGRADHARGVGLSIRSVAYLHTIVGRCLEDAVDGGLLQSNPARKAKPPKAAAEVGTREPVRTWPREILAAFLAANRAHRHHPVWLLLATTGLRRGEALGLAWSAVDLEAGRLQVTRTLVDADAGVPVWSEPKTRRGRRQIALDPATVAALKAVRVAQAADRLAVGPGYVDHDLVFALPDGRPLHPERFSRSFTELVARQGLPAIRVHDLRHTWATLALEAGIHPKVVSERLGHSTVSITLDIYSHVTPAMQADAADRVAALILGGGA
jgi:integrase